MTGQLMRLMAGLPKEGLGHSLRFEGSSARGDPYVMDDEASGSPALASPPAGIERCGRSRAGGWKAAAAAVALGTAVSGCGTLGYSSHDLRLETIGDTIYLLARSDAVSRNLSASLGGDVARVEGRLASVEGRTMQIGRVGGCHTVRHLIVCSDGDAACLAHEERHKQEGAFHR